MKKFKYLFLVVFVFGLLAMSCNDENISPLGGGGEDDDPPISTDSSKNNAVYFHHEIN
ncbi:hypothetical protein [Fulvivirga imtechensis]|nr:hypothetical protein [Fulvivirga imtechensis]